MEENYMKLEKGMVVQLSPDNCRNPMFKGCMLVISELKSFGVQGYVQSLGEKMEMGGQAYYRANWDEFEYVGKTVWDFERDI